MDDGKTGAVMTEGPPQTSIDPQDPLPESNWFWRRLLIFVGLGLCVVGLGLILAILYQLATIAALSPDTANATQVQLHTIEALYNLGFWLVMIILVNLGLYLIAPSAEQATKMLATVSALKGGVSFNSRSAISTPTSRAETSSSAGVTAAVAPVAGTEPAPALVAATELAPAPVAAPAPAPVAAADPTLAPVAAAEPAPAPVTPAVALASLPKAAAMVSVDLLRIACPETPREQLALYVEPIRQACARFEINTIRRVAAFIAQMAHESGLKPISEDLNYRAKRLAEVWPGRFATNPKAAQRDRQPNDLAKSLEHNPEGLANHVYAGRMGNGPPPSGDGWKFRGAGPLQLTGRDNWTRFAKAIGKKLEDALAYGRTPEGGVMAAAWFWEANDINRLADTPGVADESKKINGGANGLADREKKFNALVRRMLQLEKAPA